jgi:hypothetical protein
VNEPTQVPKNIKLNCVIFAVFMGRIQRRLQQCATVVVYVTAETQNAEDVGYVISTKVAHVVKFATHANKVVESVKSATNMTVSVKPNY